jgi:vacuolar protein-sorting-associated protein 4
LAQAIATAKNGPFFALSSGDFVDKYQGESEQRIRTAFQKAKSLENSVMLIDEIDSIAAQRSSDDSQSVRSMKAELWLQVDSMMLNPSVVFVGATNHPWDLEPAVLRRFKKKVYIPLPTEEDRKAFLDQAIHRPGSVPSSVSSQDLDSIAKATEFYSGAELALLLETAKELAAREVMDATCFCVDPVTGVHSIQVQSANQPLVRKSFNDIPLGKAAPNPLTVSHLRQAMMTQKAATTKDIIKRYDDWTSRFGQSGQK